MKWAWTPERQEKIARLLMQDGWQVLCEWMDAFEKECAHNLATKSFTDLLEVGRLQGQITAMQLLRATVAKRGALE